MQIGFSTAVNYGHLKMSADHLVEAFDDYFYLGGRRAYVLSGLKDGKRNVNFETRFLSEKLALNVLKIITYISVIIPIIMAVGKLISRALRKYEVINPEALQKTMAIMTPPLLGIMSEYIDKHANLTPQGLEEMQGMVETFSQSEQDAQVVWKTLAVKMGVSEEQLKACDTSAKLLAWIKEEIAHPLIAICSRLKSGRPIYVSRTQNGDEFLKGLENFSRFEQAKRIDHFLRTKAVHLAYIRLNNLGLRRFPAAFWELKSFGLDFDLSANHLKELPPEISGLKEFEDEDLRNFRF